MSIVIDASVLIALINSEDPHHDWAVTFFTETVAAELVMSALSLAEALVHPERAGKTSEFLQSISGLDLDIAEITRETALQLASVRAASGLKMPDAAVLQLALARGAGVSTLDAQLAHQSRAHGLATYTLAR